MAELNTSLQPQLDPASLRQLLLGAPHVYFMAIDSTGLVIDANAALAASVGKSLPELLRTSVWDYVHPDDVAPTQLALNKLDEAHPTLEVKTRWRHTSGQLHIISWHARQLQGRVVGLGFNVSERTSTVDDLRASSEEFRLIAETIPHLVWRTRLDGSADYLSERFVAYQGFAEKELLGWGWAGLLHPDDKDLALKKWDEARRACATIDVEVRARNVRGEYRWYHIVGNPYRDAAGEFTRYYGTWTDIEAQRQATFERDTLVAQLQAAVLARDQFLSVASHELKTPLTPLKMQLQALKRLIGNGRFAEVPTQRIDRLVGVSDRLINRITGLIDDLLDVTRIGRDSFNLRFERADLRDVILETLARYTPEIEMGGGSVDLQICGPIDGLWDSCRIEQVVSNLLTNVIRYAPGKPVVVSLSCNAQEAFLSICDQGIGIAPDDLERIFERFERVNKTRAAGGLGLGLFICQEIVKAHGGHLTVRSVLHRGTTFKVVLPRRLPDPTMPAALA